MLVTWEMDLSMMVGLMHLGLGRTGGSETPVLTSGMPSDPQQVMWGRPVKAFRAVSPDLVLVEWTGLPRLRTSRFPGVGIYN